MFEFKIERQKKEFEKDGEQVKYTAYYLVGSNGSRIQIKAVFKNDQRTLYALSSELAEAETAAQ